MKWLRRLFVIALVLGATAAAAGWVLTAPDRLDDQELAGLPQGDAARGERIFWAGGCASCHARTGSTGDARFELVGGVELATPFGTFVAPNISQHPQDGIGAWRFQEFANAMLKGVAPDGSHYYPAFPYASYARMQPADIADLFAFLKTLPAVEGESAAHRLGFPFNIRRGLGLWKLLYLRHEPVIALPEGTQEPVLTGRYLVEGPAHCGECHTPRTPMGGVDASRWLAGAPPPVADAGPIPNITSGERGIGDWSEADIVTLLETGQTPEFDFVGGPMAEVVRTISQLPAADRAAIAAYLKAVPPQASAAPERRAAN